MILIDSYHPAADQQRPGAWTQKQIDEWNRAKACSAEGHPPFWLMGPRPSDDTCPGCDSIIRSITDRQGWADHAAELHAEEQAHQLALLEDREAAR